MHHVIKCIRGWPSDVLASPVCTSLCLEESFHKLEPSTVPEMQRSNLAPVVLQLKALGIDNVLRFHFLSVSGWMRIVEKCKPRCLGALFLHAFVVISIRYFFSLKSYHA